jgi:hypothetical protein
VTSDSKKPAAPELPPATAAGESDGDDGPCFPPEPTRGERPSNADAAWFFHTAARSVATTLASESRGEVYDECEALVHDHPQVAALIAMQLCAALDWRVTRSYQRRQRRRSR